MPILSATSSISPVYYVFAALIAADVCATFALMLYYGLRARRNVKRERITGLADGFSPLDVKRIFIGKTYPRRLTRALLSWWGKCGYIRVTQCGHSRVKVTVIEHPPEHDGGAVFFDRGTYVRERDLFEIFANKLRANDTVSVFSPLFEKNEVREIHDRYATREDEGVYTQKHYTLKLVGLALSVLPLLLLAICGAIITKTPMFLLLIAMGLIGLFVLRFLNDMPIIFKLIWCGLWLGASVGGLVGFFLTELYDPFRLIWIAIAMFFGGPFLFIRFIDYRAPQNLADYSDLVNYRRHLLFTPKSELENTDDYYETLPYLYALGIKPLVGRKLGRRDRVPEWFVPDGSGRSALL